MTLGVMDEYEMMLKSFIMGFITNLNEELGNLGEFINNYGEIGGFGNGTRIIRGPF